MLPTTRFSDSRWEHRTANSWSFTYKGALGFGGSVFRNMSPFVLLVTLLTIVNGHPTRENLLPRVIEAVDRAIAFFSSDFSDINVDGLFGLRIGQGQIIEALNECKTKSCPRYIARTLSRFQEDMDTTCKKAMPYIEASSPDYFERFKETIDKPYILGYNPSKFRELEDVPMGHDQSYTEEEGDRCYARMLGTFKEHNQLLPRCNLTQPCLDLMTKENTKRYSITHQLLYFMVIEHTGCDEKLNKYSSSLTKEGIREIEDRFCKEIYKEASSLAEGGEVEIGSQDLFLEQSVLCGALGYEDFLKPQYIDMVLKMQAPEGCFKIGIDEMRSVLKKLRLKKSRRHLLREQKMSDGCLAHKSGLGIGTLSLYLRYLVRSLM